MIVKRGTVESLHAKPDQQPDVKQVCTFNLLTSSSPSVSSVLLSWSNKGSAAFDLGIVANLVDKSLQVSADGRHWIGRYHSMDCGVFSVETVSEKSYTVVH